MNLHCNVKVIDRRYSAHNINNETKNNSASLAFVQGPRRTQFSVLLVTPKNRLGTNYNLIQNVNNVFTKFAREGKATIRFIEPEHDVCIAADPKRLTSFLIILKKILTGQKVGPGEVSSYAAKITYPTRRQDIRNMEEYPSGPNRFFLPTLESLSISNLKLVNFDADKLLQLRRLSVLHINNNLLTTFPRELGCLRLTELNISYNKVTDDPHNWLWTEGNIRHTLSDLSICGMGLTKIPFMLLNLQKLQLLHMSENKVSELLPQVCLLPRLTIFNASSNELSSLPFALTRPGKRRLCTLQISDNPIIPLSLPAADRAPINTPTLMQLAAQAVLVFRLPYYSADMPWTAFKALCETGCCKCGYPSLKTPLMTSETHPVRNCLMAGTCVENIADPANVYFTYQPCSPKCI